MTNDPLKEAILNQTQRLTHMGLDLLALKKCLLEKGLISEQELSVAEQKVYAEAKQALAGLEEKRKHN
jgi:hypothetical protein